MTKSSVIVVAYGEEPGLEACLWSISSELTPGDEIVVVDNGVWLVDERQSQWPGECTVVRTGSNVGFAGGANAGAEAAQGSVLIFVNSDLVVHADAISGMRDRVRKDPAVLATGSLRLMSDPNRINSAGNPVHFTGLAWAGGFGETAQSHSLQCAVTTASGGFMAVDREGWKRLGGFASSYFMYHEDVEFSLRWWMSGGRVEYLPQASAVHDYNFSRNAQKMYYLERNRLATVLTTYPSPVLARILPALVASEIGITVLAALQGWLNQKMRAYVELWRTRAQIRERRAGVQGSYTEPATLFLELLTPRVQTAGYGRVRGLWLLNLWLEIYWKLVTRIPSH